MDQTIETVVLNNLIHNEDYCRSVFPFLKVEYFKDKTDKILYELIVEYVTKYSHTPSKEALVISLQNRDGLIEEQYNSCEKFISSSKKVTWMLFLKFYRKHSPFRLIIKWDMILLNRQRKDLIFITPRKRRLLLIWNSSTPSLAAAHPAKH